MRRLEHLFVLRPQARQIVDVEEPPVVDLVCGDAPIREPVRLPLEQLMQRLERLAPLRDAVQRARRCARRAPRSPVIARKDPRGGAFGHDRLVVRDLALGLAGRAVCGGSACSERRMLSSSIPSVRSAAVRRRDSACTAGLENERISRRIERKPVLVVAHADGTGPLVELEHEIAREQHVAILIAEHGHEHLVSRASGSPVANRCRSSPRSATLARSRAR